MQGEVRGTRGKPAQGGLHVHGHSEARHSGCAVQQSTEQPHLGSLVGFKPTYPDHTMKEHSTQASPLPHCSWAPALSSARVFLPCPNRGLGFALSSWEAVTSRAHWIV